MHSAAKELLEIPNAPAPQEVLLSHLTEKISGVMKDSGKPINLFSSEGQTALEIIAILTELAENFETRVVGYIPVRISASKDCRLGRVNFFDSRVVKSTRRDLTKIL